MYAFLYSAAKLTHYTLITLLLFLNSAAMRNWRLARTKEVKILQERRQTGNLSSFLRKYLSWLPTKETRVAPPHSISFLPETTPFNGLSPLCFNLAAFT